MSPELVIGLIGGYFLLLVVIARFTSKGADTQTFFTANRQSPWYLVAFGMIGASLSGVTFISVPEKSETASFILSGSSRVFIGLPSNCHCFNAFILSFESCDHLYLFGTEVRLLVI